ncbi:MAG: alpha/beta hydrolase [Candidatus Diapherotrites archaeon]|nr:alpha/beta hydrolase [Candidatus Diapherotrites archaeon]
MAMLFVMLALAAGCVSQQQEKPQANEPAPGIGAAENTGGNAQQPGTEISGEAGSQTDDADAAVGTGSQDNTQTNDVNSEVSGDGTSGDSGNAQQTETPAVQPEKVSFRTFDNVTIVGDFYFSGAGAKTVLLLHELGNDRHVWDNFIPKLLDAGYNVLAIDFRGHGESKIQNGSIITYKAFLDDDWQLLTQDQKSARDFLFGTKDKLSNNGIIVAGASIGANAGINFARSNPEVEKVVLLSAGESYHGLTVSGGMVSSMNSQKGMTKVLLVSSADDKYSYDSSQKIAAGAPKNTELINLEKAGHGTQMLANDSGLADKIIAWMKK